MLGSSLWLSRDLCKMALEGKLLNAVRNANKSQRSSCLLFQTLASPGKRAGSVRHRRGKLFIAVDDAGTGKQGLRARLQGL